MERPLSVAAKIGKSRYGTCPPARTCRPLLTRQALFCVSHSVQMERPWSVQAAITRSRCGEYMRFDLFLLTSFCRVLPSRSMASYAGGSCEISRREAPDLHSKEHAWFIPQRLNTMQACR